MSTAGAIDFKSDKERTATYTKQAAKQAKEQTKIMRAQAAQGAYQAPPAPPAPGAQRGSNYITPGSGEARPAPRPSNYYVPPRGEVPPAPRAASSETDDLAMQLSKLGEMKQAGLLTDDEFAAAKAKLLG